MLNFRWLLIYASLLQIQAQEKALEFERAMHAIDEDERQELAKIAALMKQKQVHCSPLKLQLPSFKEGCEMEP